MGQEGFCPPPSPLPPSLWLSLSLFLLWHLFVTQLSLLFSFWGAAESCELLTPLASLGFSSSPHSSAVTCGVRLGVLDGQVVPCRYLVLMPQ